MNEFTEAFEGRTSCKENGIKRKKSEKTIDGEYLYGEHGEKWG